MSPVIAEAFLVACLSLCIRESTSIHQPPAVSSAQSLQTAASPSHRYVLVPFLGIPQAGTAGVQSLSQSLLMPQSSPSQAQPAMYLILPQSPQGSLASSIVGSLQGPGVQTLGLSASSGQSGVSHPRPLLLSYLGLPNVGQTHAAVRPISSSSLQTLHQPVLAVAGSSSQHTVQVGSGGRLSPLVASQSLASSWLWPMTNTASGLQSPAVQDDHATQQKALEEAGHLIVRNKTLLLRLGDAMADALGKTDFMLCPLVLEDNGLYLVVPPPGSAVLKCLPNDTCRSLQEFGEDVCPCVPGSCPLVRQLTRLCPLLHLQPEPPCAKAKNASRTASQAEVATTTSSASSTAVQSTGPATEAPTASSTASSDQASTTTAVDTTTATTTIAAPTTTTTTMMTTTTPTNTGAQCRSLVDCDMNTDFCNLLANDLWRITEVTATRGESADPVTETAALSRVGGPAVRSADMVLVLGSDLDGSLEISLSYFFYSPATLIMSVEFTPLRCEGTPVPAVDVTVTEEEASSSWTELKRSVVIKPGSLVQFTLRLTSTSAVDEAVAIDNVSLSLCP